MKYKVEREPDGIEKDIAANGEALFAATLRTPSGDSLICRFQQLPSQKGCRASFPRRCPVHPSIVLPERRLFSLG